MGRFAAVVACTAGFLRFASAATTIIPSPQSMNGSVTLLYSNDLDGKVVTLPAYTAAEHRSVLLLSPRLYTDAEDACVALGETLLPVNETFFSTDLSYLLQYQEYIGAYKELQQYWVGNASACQVVDRSGIVGPSACDDELPVLCTQSAVFDGKPASGNLLTVNSNGLAITGYRDQLSFRFEGIPYANPPQRFKYPTPYTGPSVINATEFGTACIQQNIPTGSEDCLFLNVWTPYIPSNATVSLKLLKPVMFWIHGGAFDSGTGADPTFAGGNMASRGDIVVVTMNYRLSTLGFLALSDGKTNGNFGIADQIAALDWVRDHISAFGGDPERITIAGQSAGAAAVRALLGSPEAIGKYAAAIPMSNLAGRDFAATYSSYYSIAEEVDTVVQPILEEIGCNITEALACLTAYEAFDLVNLTNIASYIVVDGTYVVYPELPLNGSGAVADVHTLMGYMRDDGAPFIGYPTSDNITAGLRAQDLPTKVANSSLFVQPTGANATLDVFNVTARIATDIEFRCLDQATAWSASIWFYQFNRSYQLANYSLNDPTCQAPVSPAYPYGDPSQEYFKCHAGELYYVFGTLPSDKPYRDTQDLPFMQLTLDIWTAFVRTYNPNPDPLYLAVRGYTTTATQLALEEPWLPVTQKTLDTTPLRTLQWGSFQGALAERPQCEFLGYPLDYFG
ncbi:carboxylesterase from carbohydrate esterase [Amylocystis lapponica]|nr:carboxylesterase from carbohydrate esterase [Amylocystis lapponica]